MKPWEILYTWMLSQIMFILYVHRSKLHFFSLQGICEWVYSCRFSLSYKKYISKALDFTRSLQKQVELYGISCQGLKVDEIHVALLFNMMWISY